MIVWLCLRWWYGAGWRWVWQRAVERRVQWCLETFSMRILVATWFAPFKQTYAGGGRGSIGDHIRAFFDRLISRVIGFLVRSIVLLTGTMCIMLSYISGLLFIIFWAVIPPLPILGVILMALRVGA